MTTVPKITGRKDDLCSTHQKAPSPGHRCETCKRIRIEKKIMRRTVKDLIAAGFKVSIWNGECYEIVNSVKLNDIMKVTFLTDEDIVYVHDGDAPVHYDADRDVTHAGPFDSFVRFIYGNSGWDVISDYGVSLENIIKPIMDYAETFEPV